ncbi:MAG: hypothetical protein WDZ76_08010 [Pseudohongiellaceae bacterium]
MTYATLFNSFLITGISLLMLKPFAHRMGLVDVPGGRKTHEKATPLIGGLGIFLGTLVMILFTPNVFHEYGALLALASLVLFVGLLDDAIELRVSVRMGAHGFAALVMATVADVKLESLGNLLGAGPVELGLLSVPLTVFATVGVINAVNMADGLDGLSGGLVLIALACIAAVAAVAGNFELLALSTILGCSLAAFLTMNFRLLWKKNALVYLGDAGSTMLGFMVAWILISESQGPDASFAPVFALWFLAVPLLDTVYLLIGRPLRKISPFTPGVDHLHHNLIRHGLSVKTTVMLLFATAAAFGTIGLIGYLMQVSETFMFLAFMVLFTLYVHVGQLLGQRTKASAG